MRTPALILLGCVLTTGACSSDPSELREWRPEDHSQPAQPDPASLPPEEPQAPVDPAVAEQRAIAALWNVTCAGCHGRDGSGGGPNLPPGTQAPNLRDPSALAGRSDAQLAESIRNGKGMMPAFGKQVGDSGIVALVAHVRSLSQR